MNITGTTASDNLVGTDDDDIISGGDGGDILDGGTGNDQLYGESGDDSYVIRDRFDYVYDSDGADSAVVYVDFYKTNSTVESWSWASGVQRLPYWIDALLPGLSTGFPALLEGDKTIYYCFPASAPTYFSSEDANGYEAFNAQQMAFAKQALAYISSVVDLTFVETNDPYQLNTIAFGNNIQTGSSAYAYYPYGDNIGSDVLLNADQYNLAPAVGEYSALVMIHELGHALGLKHPFNGGGTTEGPYLPSHEDWSEQTVMSYEDYPYTYDLSYSPLDIAALQYLYGPSKAVSTDDVYVLNPYEPNFIWDGGGTDTIDGSASTQSITLYLEHGYWSYIGSKATQIYGGGQLTVNFGTVIENAKGGKAGDLIFGNGAGNNIWGLAGNDIIDGGAGDDVIDGGDGGDTIQGLSGKDVIFGGEGEDNLFLTQSMSQMEVIKLRDNTFIVTDASASNVALCRDVEQLHFSDAHIALADKQVTHTLDSELAQIYVAAFRRAPELEGYNYWSQEVATSGMEAVANTMFSLDAVKTLYSDSMTSEQFVSSIYSNVFNREPEADGLAYWTQQLALKSRGEIVVDMTNAALNAVDGTAGKDYFQNRLDWSLYVVEYQIQQSTGLTTEQLSSLTSTVGADTGVLISLIGQAESGAMI